MNSAIRVPVPGSLPAGVPSQCNMLIVCMLHGILICVTVRPARRHTPDIAKTDKNWHSKVPIPAIALQCVDTNRGRGKPAPTKANANVPASFVGAALCRPHGFSASFYPSTRHSSLPFRFRISWRNGGTIDRSS